MKAYLEVKDILARLDYNHIDTVSIINLEGDKLIDHIKWGHDEHEKVKGKEYMTYEPFDISVERTADNKINFIIKCVAD